MPTEPSTRAYIKLSEIKPAKNHSRPHGVGDVSELADSLAQGQLQPVVISSDGFLAIGYRRVAAAESLGWDEIWCDYSDKTLEELTVANLVENLCRKDLSLWDEIEGIRSVFGDKPSVREVSRAVSKSRNWVEPRVRVWELPKEFIDEIRLNKVDIGRLRGRLSNRKPSSTTSRYIEYPTQTEVRDAVTRLVEQGRNDEARALSYALGTITVDDLLRLQSD